MKLLTGTLILGVTVALAACARSVPPPPSSAEGGDVSKSRQHAFNEAVDALHDQIHSPKADIAGVTQDDVTWNDSCLGCGRTGEKCTNVLTPGYRIVLRVRDATYEYHSDRGGKVRLCSQAPVPGSLTAPAVVPTPGF
ncbi:MAG: hypothetical protein LC796_16555 [Acidobacteria bacterium]|nr:hypothetical protein [Acidobacteriota bacterium]MCA1610123.1 hypothetical protein [Acidobacteriota bacterium]